MHGRAEGSRASYGQDFGIVCSLYLNFEEVHGLPQKHDR
jgi:hypothetical protein